MSAGISPAAAVAPHGSASATPTPTYVPGTLIGGKYRLVSRLGEGGMGSVWSAKNTVLDLDVALKLIRREMAGPEMGARLLREARATAILGHRSIVRVFDFGTTEHGDPFLVMEILEGVSLATMLDRETRLREDEAVRTLLPIADALAKAHARGILHCDVKPDNVVLVPDGPACAVPKLVDFGIAKFKASEHGLLGGPASRPGDRLDTGYSRSESGVSLIPRDELTGARLAPTVAGTPDYMSPEQAQGFELDERTDIWSLGVVLYEAVTGVRPFYHDDVHAQLQAICTIEPRPASDYQVDPSLASILQRAMAKDPAARWPTMADFGSALARWAQAIGVETDITGTSLAERWSEARRTPTMPPPVERPLEQPPAASGDATPPLGTPPLRAVREPETTLPVPLIARRVDRERETSEDALAARWFRDDLVVGTAPKRRRRRPRRRSGWRAAAVVVTVAAAYVGVTRFTTQGSWIRDREAQIGEAGWQLVLEIGGR